MYDTIKPLLLIAQQTGDKERAEQIAKEDFSKSKYMKKEKIWCCERAEQVDDGITSYLQ